MSVVSEVGGVSGVEQALELAERGIAELEASSPLEITLRRAKAWKLRVMGYSLQEIGDELGLSVYAAHSDIKWCLENFPPAYETAEAFRHISLEQLDRQYRMLLAGRNVIVHEEDGEPRVLHEDPTDTAQRVALGVKDLMAKLLGAYAPTKVDAGVTIKYELVGVETDQL